jgi:8-oxo-dGTP pyrophosphatase MutT (NUDIX family)
VSVRRQVREEKSAGGVVVRARAGVPHVLLIRDPYQNWGLPKGHLEAGEDAPTAAVREVREETGLAALELGPELGMIDWYFRRDDELIHKMCSFFLMRSADGDVRPEVNEGITECEWLPVEQAVARVTYENAREMIRAAVRHLPETRSNGAGEAVPAQG